MYFLLFILAACVALALVAGIFMVVIAGISTLVTGIRKGYRSTIKAGR